MFYVKNNVFSALFFLIFTSSFSFSILPETIATITVLKGGATCIALAIGGRYLVTKSKEASDAYGQNFKKIPQAEFYNHYSESNQDASSRCIEPVHIQAMPDQTLSSKIKNIIFSQQKQQSYARADYQNGASADSFDHKKSYWNQTNIHAQHTRGFFSKINYNYYAKSDKEYFWNQTGFGIGLALGIFITHLTDMYLFVRYKKD